MRTCLGSISNTNLYLIRRILLRIISHSSNKKSNLEFFRCSCTVRFGRTVRPNRFGSVRFGSARFCIKGSADHRTFNMPGSVVLYSQTLKQVTAGFTKVAPSYRNSRTGFTFWIAQSMPLQYRVKVFMCNQTVKSMRILGEITFINKKSFKKSCQEAPNATKIDF